MVDIVSPAFTPLSMKTTFKAAVLLQHQAPATNYEYALLLFRTYTSGPVSLQAGCVSIVDGLNNLINSHALYLPLSEREFTEHRPTGGFTVRISHGRQKCKKTSPAFSFPRRVFSGTRRRKQRNWRRWEGLSSRSFRSVDNNSTPRRLHPLRCRGNFTSR